MPTMQIFAKTTPHRSRIDSGWITTLCELTPQAAEHQILWLGSLLASRGMPRYLLECHLEFLQAELKEQRRNYEVLRHCTEVLRTAREKHLSQSALEELAEQFALAVQGESGTIKNMGYVLATAAIDDRDGVANVLDSVLTWARDSQRFSAKWIEAVDRFVPTVRQRLS